MKKTISVFLIIAVMICNVNIYHVQAATNWFAVLTNAADVFVNTATPTQQSTLQLINDFLQTNGFASSIANSFSPASDNIIKYFASQIDASQANKTMQENIEAIRECVENGFTGGDTSVTFNSTLHNAIYNTANYFVNQNGPFYGYTCSISVNNIYSQYQNALLNFLPEYEDDYYIATWSSGQYTVIIPKEAYFGVLSSEDNNLYYVNTDLFYQVEGQPQFRYSNGEYVNNGTVTNFTGTKAIGKVKDSSAFNLNYVNLISTKSYPFPIYPTGSTPTYVRPYYYNNSVWQDFSTSTGDYTVTSSNVNTVTYGDITNYINDHYEENNNYPDNSTVNTWIETTNNNNNSGGGSGDDSGGGSGDDSGGTGTGIISILTALGKAIADLITGIAAFLAEVVGGLVEAITGLLDTLTDLITNFTESIPNIFSPLLGWLFDGLPEEFTAIILLGLTACVIASIIKILRG